MRIIVISDTHGSFRSLESVFKRNSDADMFIHLGDGEKDLDRFILQNPEYAQRIVHVAGNCDYGNLSPDSAEIAVAYGHRIFASHGHIFGVKSGLERIKAAARAKGCDIVLYGHTHVRCERFEDGLYILNPGSAGAPHDGKPPSFGTISIEESGILLNTADVQPSL